MGKVTHKDPTLFQYSSQSVYSCFACLGLKVMELTGDSNTENLNSELQKSDIILTTPEKWDSCSRKWKEKGMSFVNQIGLVLVDEIHILGDTRGPCLEAALCRMKTIRRILSIKTPTLPAASLRIIGVSATIVNIQDIATFLDCHPENTFNFDASFRPVPLTTHVLGFPSRQGGSPFQFDTFLSYKVYEVIKAYANEKCVSFVCENQFVAFAVDL
jgi:replicative superfamily II helicase